MLCTTDRSQFWQALSARPYIVQGTTQDLHPNERNVDAPHHFSGGHHFQPGLVCLQIGSHTSQKKIAVAVGDGKLIEDEMEKSLVDFLSSLKRPAHFGQDVGPFMIKCFGQSCRVSFLDMGACSSHAE